jgi:hypothetical protein
MFHVTFVTKSAWLILHVKLRCLSPLQHAVKSTIVTLTSCDNMPSFKSCVVSEMWSFDLAPVRDRQLLAEANPGLHRRTFPVFAEMSLHAANWETPLIFQPACWARPEEPAC